MSKTSSVRPKSRFDTIPACDGQTDGHTTIAYTSSSSCLNYLLPEERDFVDKLRRLKQIRTF